MMASTAARLVVRNAAWRTCLPTGRLSGSVVSSSRRWFASYPPHELVGMPSLSPTMESGTIANWNLNEGDEFAAGDVLCSVETDKATVDFEAQDGGFVAKILAAAGAGEIPCGQPIVITVDSKADISAFADYTVSATPATAPPTPAAAAVTPAATTTPPPLPPPTTTVATTPSGKVVASPLAYMLAKELGHDISLIPGTGPGGRIIAADVKEFVPSTAQASTAPVATTTTTTTPTVDTPAPAQAVIQVAAPIPGQGYTDYPLSASAQETAARLTQSKKNVPHYYLTVDIALDQLLKMRSTLNSAIQDKNKDNAIGVYELLIKAAAAAMKTVPSANASWMDSVVRVYDSVDMNVVVGSGDALYTPIIRNVGGRGVKSLSDDLQKFVTAVQETETIVGDVDFAATGTFTIMNLGMYGIKSCAPIIREPQACALALGTMENRIVPNDDDSSDEIYKESVMLTATLSCDHRVVDGAVGAQWLSAFKSHVENPTTLLL